MLFPTSLQDRSRDTENSPVHGVPAAPLQSRATGISELPALFAEKSVEPDADRLPNSDLAEIERPQLIGIAGRLPDDAEVLLRLPEGKSVSLRLGEEVEGYVLKSIAADRVVFIKNGREILLKMPNS